MNSTITKTILRYCISTFGIFLVAFGIVLSVNANLGINALNATPYAFSYKFPIFTLGLYNIIFFTICMLVQLVVLGRRFQWIDFLQLPANFLLGILINCCMPICSGLGLVLPTDGSPILWNQIWLLALSCIISAFGISLEVSSKAWMLPADMTVRAFTLATKGKFSTVKVIVDCSILFISIVFCYLFFGNIFGPKDTPIIGWGTLILAISIGLCMKLTQPLTDKLCSKLD